MSRIDNGERLSRSEQNFIDVRNFLESDKDSTELKLYSSEISRLSKVFPQITITKGNEFKARLFNCIVERK